ncbi:hypothetical protein [Prochlorococcus marinus]|uniref:hypothetical protein n=1 Tax=Prochlorococcus marinus TaxID=1219 RepID=UPI0039B0923F
MKILLQEQITYGYWFSWSSGTNERICYLRAVQRNRSTGKRQRLVDSDGKLLDLIF